MEYKYIEVLKKYRDANKTSSPKDEFNKLFAQFSDGKGIKNMGGFRIRKSAATGSVAFVILITNSNEAEWPDSLDIDNSTFTYYGDKRRPYVAVDDELHKTSPQGNILLRDIFINLDKQHRSEIPPFLIFKKTNKNEGVYMNFLGLAAPGIACKEPLSCLKALWCKDENDKYFLNYEALFSIIDVDRIPLKWLDDIIKTGKFVKSSYCPDAWATWANTGSYLKLSYQNYLFK